MKLRLIQRRFDEVLQDLIVGLKDGSIVLERDMGEIENRADSSGEMKTTTSPPGSPATFFAFVWANSVDKAIIELNRGRYFESEAAALLKKPTGVSLWVFELRRLTV